MDTFGPALGRPHYRGTLLYIAWHDIKEKLMHERAIFFELSKKLDHPIWTMIDEENQTSSQYLSQILKIAFFLFAEVLSSMP